MLKSGSHIFQALTYYFKDISKFKILSKFFELTNDDINLDQRRLVFAFEN